MDMEALKRHLGSWGRMVANIVITLAATGALATAKGTLDKLSELDNRLSVIEATRFSKADALELWHAIADDKREMATMPKETPPKWFEERVNRLESELKGHINDLQKQILALQSTK